jgi:hypothetical protein
MLYFSKKRKEKEMLSFLRENPGYVFQDVPKIRQFVKGEVRGGGIFWYTVVQTLIMIVLMQMLPHDIWYTDLC